MEKLHYLKVSNNQKRKHFQPDYYANDAFVDVASAGTASLLPFITV